jgi:hypothetical protein
MANGNVETRVSSEQLLKAAGQLSSSDLDEFVERVLVLRAKRKAPHLPQAEAELLVAINQSLPAETQRRYDELIAKRRAEALTPEEYSELLCLTDEVEAYDTRRVENLVKLAQLRQVTLDQLMEDLGLRPPDHA